MITQPQSSRPHLAKYFLALPLLVVLLVFFARKEQPNAPVLAASTAPSLVEFDTDVIKEMLYAALATDNRLRSFENETLRFFLPENYSYYQEAFRQLMQRYPKQQEVIRGISKKINPGC